MRHTKTSLSLSLEETLAECEKQYTKYPDVPERKKIKIQIEEIKMKINKKNLALNKKL